MKQGRSGLTLREFHAYHKPIIELTPRKVNQWVKNLPIANLGDASKSIYRILVDSNQSIIDPDKRFSILKTLCPVADHLINALEKQFLNRNIALTEKQKKIAALVQAIQTEISIGFHSIIESIVTDQIKWSNKKVLINSIAYAIKYHGLVMLRCYQLYASVPARIWRELYTLFQIAQENEIDGHNAQLESHGEERSCKDYFAQSLLLSIANPYQLRQREIGLLWELLPELSTHTDLSSHAYNKLHYVVVMDSSSPPIHKSLYNKSLSNNLKLTVSPAVDYLKQKLSSLQRSDQQTARKAMVIKHLIQTWNHGTHRSFARTPSDDSLDIAIGLGATHYILMQEPGGSDEDRSGASDTLEAMEGSLKNATLLDLGTVKREYSKSDYDYLSSSGPSSDDVWAKLYRPDQAIAEEAEKIKNNTRSRDTIVKESYQLQTVDLMNISPGGYCIQIASDKLPRHAQTGEVLGFLERSSDEREQWSIGVVRWVRRQLKGTVVQMGVQLLAPGAIPINVQLRNSKSDTNEFQRALLLPALTGVGQPATLITNPLSFRTNSKVRILDHGNEYDARLSKEVTSSSSFKQFEFERIGDATSSDDQKRKDPSFDSGGMDGVWDLI